MRENRSWHEIYVLRTFLMYNDSFEMAFFDDWSARNCRQRTEADHPTMLDYTGGSLWLRRTGR